jgi:hypothetical protein
MNLSLRILDCIFEFPEFQRTEFNKKLSLSIQDKKWCENNGLDSIKPDVNKAREMLFKEDYPKTYHVLSSNYS